MVVLVSSTPDLQEYTVVKEQFKNHKTHLLRTLFVTVGKIHGFKFFNQEQEPR
jgi:hypothetical protein